jgi:hypothetical protein
MCETWLLTKRERHTLKEFENRALRRKFGPKREDIIGRLSKMQNKELHNLYSLPSTIRLTESRKMKLARAYSMNSGVEERIWDIDGKDGRKESTRKTKT